MKTSRKKSKLPSISEKLDSISLSLSQFEYRFRDVLDAVTRPKRFEVVLIGTTDYNAKSSPISMTLDGEVAKGATANVTNSPDVEMTISSFFIMGNAKILDIKLGNCRPVAGCMSGLKFGLCDMKITPGNRISVMVEGL